MFVGARPKFYMVYLAKDDSIVATGSAEECAKQMGYKNVHSFYSFVQYVKSGKRKTHEIVVADSDVCGE